MCIRDRFHGIQAKLLRFIQEVEIFRVGGKDPIKVDIRLISATNRELDQEVQKGNFREDLFYRINTIVVLSLIHISEPTRPY